MKKKKQRTLPPINTSALPDIIFMLLFFFMVATVMRPKKDLAQLELPKAFSIEALDRIKPDQLQIILSSNEEGDIIFINTQKALLSSLSSQLSQEINRMKATQQFPDKAILHIHNSTPMRLVNSVKTALQKEHILKVEYVHQKKL